MSQQCNNNTASLPIIYHHFESTAGSHIDSIVKEMKELAREKINNIMIVYLYIQQISMVCPLIHP